MRRAYTSYYPIACVIRTKLLRAGTANKGKSGTEPLMATINPNFLLPALSVCACEHFHAVHDPRSLPFHSVKVCNYFWYKVALHAAEHVNQGMPQML